MNCANCMTQPAEFLCHREGKKPLLCSECLHASRKLFYAWQRLDFFPVCVSVPNVEKAKWAHEILIDSLACEMPKNETVVSRKGRKGFAQFFAPERN